MSESSNLDWSASTTGPRTNWPSPAYVSFFAVKSLVTHGLQTTGSRGARRRLGRLGWHARCCPHRDTRVDVGGYLRVGWWYETSSTAGPVQPARHQPHSADVGPVGPLRSPSSSTSAGAPASPTARR